MYIWRRKPFCVERRRQSKSPTKHSNGENIVLVISNQKHISGCTLLMGKTQVRFKINNTIVYALYALGPNKPTKVQKRKRKGEARESLQLAKLNTCYSPIPRPSLDRFPFDHEMN